MTDWVTITRRNARSVQTTIGWIFWDPGAVARFEALGLPGPVGYIAARCAPLAPAGRHAVTAAFGSIRPAAIEFTFALVEQQTDFASVWAARDDAVREGLQLHAPDAIDALLEFGPAIWELIPSLPTVGRPFYASHLSMTRSCDPVLDAWHGVNLLREWRGDTHWALVVAAGLTGIEASVLHNAWLGYERDWLPSSRGSSAEEISIGWQSLEDRGLVADGEVTPTGIALRQHLEDETDARTSLPWELLGDVASRRFAEVFEPPCERLLRRVDETAGPNYQPASRVR